MKFSDDRINHLAHMIQDKLYHDDLVDYTDDAKALQEIKRTLTAYLQLEEHLEPVIRQKIATLKRGVDEGSPEWDVLFRKYLEEELAKRQL